LAVGLPALIIPVTILQFKGAGRWILVGATAASGFWLAVLVAVLFSGAAGLVMAIASEERTADTLRLLTRKGWRIVNGLRLRGDADIDHIAVGPAGVLVLETKWVSEPWPLEAPAKPFLADSLKRWAEQAKVGQWAVRNHFRGRLGDAPVLTVLVVWTSDTFQKGHDWFDYDGVTVVPGLALGRWLQTLDASRVAADRVRTIWLGLERHAKSRDAKDEERRGPPAPTLVVLLRRLVVEPYVGFMALFYVVGIVVRFRHMALFIITLAVSLVAGMAARRRRRLRPAATGWLAGWATVIVLSGIAIVVNLA
jgi:hypothetical protein